MKFKIMLQIMLLFLCYFMKADNMVEIKNLIILAEKEVVDLTVIWELKNSKSFNIIEQNANNIINDSLILFQSKDLSIQQKMILLFAIQNVNFNDYKNFLLNLALCYRKDKVDSYIMKRALIPFDWNFNVIENYKDKQIIKVLNICLANDKIEKDFKEVINDILSGKALKEHKKFIKRKK